MLVPCHWSIFFARRKTLRNRKSLVDSHERRKSRRHSTGTSPLSMSLNARLSPRLNHSLGLSSLNNTLNSSLPDDDDESSSSQSSQGHLGEVQLNGSYKENKGKAIFLFNYFTWSFLRRYCPWEFFSNLLALCRPDSSSVGHDLPSCSGHFIFDAWNTLVSFVISFYRNVLTYVDTFLVWRMWRKTRTLNSIMNLGLQRINTGIHNVGYFYTLFITFDARLSDLLYSKVLSYNNVWRNRK